MKVTRPIREEAKAMRDQIVDFIRERGGGVSFAEFKRRFGDAFEGDLAMCLTENENVVFWGGMSEEFYEALASLLSDEVVQMTPTSFLVYLADGVTSELQLVRGLYRYKTPHWLPVTFSLAEGWALSLDGVWLLYFDGVCGPRNPGGVACYGWLVKRNGATLSSGCGEAVRGPGATSNVAEYAALIAGLEALAGLALGGDAAEVRGDSRLVINQVTGRWQVRSKRLRPWHQRVEALAAQIERLTWRWVPRSQNQEADALSREAYRVALQGE